MKSNKVFLASLFILAILSLGAVNASDNATDNLLGDGFAQYSDGSGTQDANMQVSWPDEVKLGNQPAVNFTLPDDVSADSKVLLFINNQRIDDGVGAQFSSYEFSIDDYGTYDLKVKFIGDSKYAPSIKEKRYVVSDYMFEVEKPASVIYGEDTQILIQLPYDAEGILKVNDVMYAVDGDNSFYVHLDNLRLGNNTVRVTYSNDDKYKSKTQEFNVEAVPGVIYKQNATFDDVTFRLNLPSDAKGELVVSLDGVNGTSKFKNGHAEVRFDGLALGTHTFIAYYSGSDYACDLGGEKQFVVIPKITVNSFASANDNNTVDIAIPQGEWGTIQIILYRFSDEIGSVTYAGKMKDIYENTSIPFSKIPSGYYQYDIRYFSPNGYTYVSSCSGVIRNYFDMNVSCPESVLADDANVAIIVSYPSSSDGEMVLYVDGDVFDRANVDESGWVEFALKKPLSSGNHVIDVRFSGNDIYAPANRTFTVTSNYYISNIPSEILINDDDVISINIAKDATGQLAVYVDGVEFARKDIKNGYAEVNMSSLPFNSYNVRISYEKGNYPSFSKDQVLKVAYTFKMDDERFYYGEDNIYTLMLPSDLATAGLVVKVDDVEYPWSANGNVVSLNVSSLGIGSHTVNASHPGSDKYYSLSVEKTIEVAGKINAPRDVQLGDDQSIYLILPQNPIGKLIIYAFSDSFNNYIQIATVSFGYYSEGRSIATYSLSNLGVGKHALKATYSGSDYDVDDVYKDISVNLDVEYADFIQYGNTYIITVKLKNARGSVDAYLDEFFYDSFSFSDGVATIRMNDIDVGQHTFQLQSFSYPRFEFEGKFAVYPVMNVPATIIDGASPATVSSGYSPVGSVFIYDNGKLIGEVILDGGKQSISLSGLAAGTHKITIVYDSWEGMKYSRVFTTVIKKATIIAKDMSMDYLDGSVYKVLIKDYKGKAVGKNQQVKFYVDGKLFKTVKTDKNGYASVVFNHVPNKHTIKIVYKATTVTKKLTVKQILSLKKVTPKKSAKKLVLTATLKKVKGKYLKNKQIVFKFNGKTYKAKTNSKGVAKVTVPKAVLKKLRVGANLVYQATYVKATVKYSVKVKK